MHKKIITHILLCLCATNTQLIVTGEEHMQLNRDYAATTGALFALIQVENTKMPTQHDQPPLSLQEQETENWKFVAEQVLEINERLIAIQDEQMTTIATLLLGQKDLHWKDRYFQLKRNILYGLSLGILAVTVAYPLFEAYYYQSDQH